MRYTTDMLLTLEISTMIGHYMKNPTEDDVVRTSAVSQRNEHKDCVENALNQHEILWGYEFSFINKSA